jgi:hypothetical protein
MVNLQRVLAGSPVLEPSGVGKDVPRRNQIQAWIAFKKSNRGYAKGWSVKFDGIAA